MGLWLREWLTVRVCALRSWNIIAGRTCAVDECEVQWWYREMFVMLCVILLFFLPDISMEFWKLEELLAADCLVDAQQWASWLVNQRWMKKTPLLLQCPSPGGPGCPQRKSPLSPNYVHIHLALSIYSFIPLRFWNLSPGFTVWLTGQLRFECSDDGSNCIEGWI